MTKISRRVMLAFGASALLGAGTHALCNSPKLEIMLGAGQFVITGGKGHEDHSITVHYYRPPNYTAKSPILIVVPGAGRNSNDYRDAWIAVAKDKGIFIASPSYAEQDYDQGAYQMGGIIKNFKIIGRPLPGSSADSVYLHDEDLRFDANPQREEWLFNDFDRLFQIIKESTNSKQSSFDLFGHSAGAQILHRHVLAHPNSLARRVIAANAGFYSLPDLNQPLPIGLAGLNLDQRTLRKAFSHQLWLLLGENDNDPDKGGMHLHTPQIDKQGNNRLARGKYFFEFATTQAKLLNVKLNWRLRVVPGVGHDYRAMSKAAASILYGY